MRIPSQDGNTYTSIITFDSALVEVLTELKPGDPVTVVGTGKLSTYTTRDGDTRPNLSVTASRIITLTDRQVEPRQRKAKPPVASVQADAFTPAGKEFADEIPSPFERSQPHAHIFSLFRNSIRPAHKRIACHSTGQGHATDLSGLLPGNQLTNVGRLELFA